MKRKQTQRQMAARANISRRTLQAYKAAGVDVTSLQDIKRHQSELRHSGILPQREPPSSALSRAKVALTKAQADKAELHARRLKRELVPATQVRADVAAIQAAVSSALDCFCESLPSRLAGMSPPEMECIIRSATQSLLERLSDVAAYGA